MSDETLNVEDAAQYETLGPVYFAARRVVEAAMHDFTNDHLKEIAKTTTDAIYEKVQTAVEDHLWSDAELNLQGKMWRMVDQIVQGILSGEKWIADRYALGTRYDCGAARKAIAAHFEDAIAKARIADLEAEVERLKKDNEWLRR